MADSDLSIFDFQFGINQFSGNQSLLVQILEKFILQYQHFETSLTEDLQHENLQSAKQQVHTIKGVSGNLGMTALHSACRKLESQLNSQVSEHPAEDFLQVFNQTLTVIKRYCVENSNASPPEISSETAPQQDGKTLLIAALKREEFISDSKMENYTQSLGFSSAQLNQLNDLIDNLDYAGAIALLE